MYTIASASDSKPSVAAYFNDNIASGSSGSESHFYRDVVDQALRIDCARCGDACTVSMFQKDVLIAGFPCQPFSRKRKDRYAKGAPNHDLYCVEELINLILVAQPLIVILENVVEVNKLEPVAVNADHVDSDVAASLGSTTYDHILDRCGSNYFGNKYDPKITSGHIWQEGFRGDRWCMSKDVLCLTLRSYSLYQNASINKRRPSKAQETEFANIQYSLEIQGSIMSKKQLRSQSAMQFFKIWPGLDEHRGR